MDGRRDTLSRRGYPCWSHSPFFNSPPPLAWCILLLFVMILSPVRSAFVPTPVTGAAYASSTNDNRALFIHGGSTSKAVGIIPQLFSINLAVPWSLDNPAYAGLTEGPFDSLHGMVLSKDQSELILFSDAGSTTQLYQYNIAQGAWSGPFQPLPSSNNDPNVNGTVKVDSQPYRTVADPETGMIYVPLENIRSLAVIDPTDLSGPGGVSITPLNPVLSGCFDFAAIWSSKRRSILFYGGKNASCPAVEYQPSTNTWNTLEFKGTEPEWRLGLCMAEAHGGERIVLFGGRTETPSVYLKDIYILDMATLTWTAGEETETARGYHACTAAGDMFVSWGGRDTAGVLTNNVLVVYDLKNSRWTTSYTPPSSSSSTDSKLPMGAIAGSAVGVVVITMASAGYFFYRSRKRRRQNQVKDTDNQSTPSPSVSKNQSMSLDDHPDGALLTSQPLSLDDFSPTLSIATLPSVPACMPSSSTQEIRPRAPHAVLPHAEGEATDLSPAEASPPIPSTYLAPPPAVTRQPRAPQAIIEGQTIASTTASSRISSTTHSPNMSSSSLNALSVPTTSTLTVPSSPAASRLMNSEEITLKLKLMEEQWYEQQEGLKDG